MYLYATSILMAFFQRTYIHKNRCNAGSRAKAQSVLSAQRRARSTAIHTLTLRPFHMQ